MAKTCREIEKEIMDVKDIVKKNRAMKKDKKVIFYEIPMGDPEKEKNSSGEKTSRN